jgi:hypothetical protein
MIQGIEGIGYREESRQLVHAGVDNSPKIRILIRALENQTGFLGAFNHVLGLASQTEGIKSTI